jgi:hypothetical protein
VSREVDESSLLRSKRSTEDGEDGEKMDSEYLNKERNKDRRSSLQNQIDILTAYKPIETVHGTDIQT